MRKGSLPAVLGCVATLSQGCTTWTKADLAKREDYLGAMTLHAGDRSADALAVFPAKEPGGFVTTLERGWLETLSGRPDPDAMAAVGRDLEARQTLRVTRETTAYFYKETEDGYVPAEHEAIAFHIVTGFAFAKAGRRAEALVEARKAAFYLQNDYGTQPGFDDPALRLWLAALWTYCGEWASARVDLRRAAALDPSLSEAKRLAEHDAPPLALALALSGPGPDVVWEPALLSEGRPAIDAIRFVPGAGPAFVGQGAPTLAWYLRHQERDQAIRRLLNASRDVAEGLAPAGLAGTTFAVGLGAGVLIAGLGIAAGGAIIYYTVALGRAMPAEVQGVFFALGGGVAVMGVRHGVEVAGRAGTLSEQLLDAGFNPTDAYRYVRFLPDYVQLEALDQAPAPPYPKKALDGREHAPRLVLEGPPGGARVLVYAAGGSRVEARQAALRATWIDRTHQGEWALLPSLETGHDASEACADLSRAAGRAWRLPTWTEVLDARQAGLFDPETAPGLAPRFRLEKSLWSRDASPTPQPDRCRVVDLRDFSELTVKDCATPRAVACVAKATAGEL